MLHLDKAYGNYPIKIKHHFNIKFMFSLLLTFISELIYFMSIVSKGH